MLTSVHNERVKSAAALARRNARSKTGRFLLEGPQAVDEALTGRHDLVDEVFVTPGASVRVDGLAATAERLGIRVTEVSDPVLRAIADTVTPQGILAVARQAPTALEQVLPTQPSLVAILHRIADPGNAGAVLRVADAAGADAVVFTQGSVDPYNPKAVRATTGSLFHLPMTVDAPLEQAVEVARSAGLQVLAADVSGEVLHSSAAHADLLAQATAWVFGNEAHGLTEEELALCDGVIRLPIFGRAESLNLATAAAVLLYQSAFHIRG